MIAESRLEEEDAYQLKFYAVSVGNVHIGRRGAYASQEELELVEFVQLGPEVLAEIHALALHKRHMRTRTRRVYRYPSILKVL